MAQFEAHLGLKKLVLKKTGKTVFQLQEFKTTEKQTSMLKDK